MADIESTRLQVPTSLGDAPAFLRNAASQLQEELDTLARQLAPIEAEWTGGSGDAYQEVQSMWNSDATALFDPDTGVLGQIATAVQAVVNNFDLTENFNVRTWQTF